MSEIVNNLLAKLAGLLGDECQKLKGVERHVRFLEDELSTMKAFLDELGLRDELDPLTKNWRDHVRDMAYDMEDCLDDFLVNLGSASDNAGFIDRTTELVNILWARHQFTSQIQELKDRAIEANHRRKRYKLDDSSSSSSALVPVDPRVSALYREAASLVGIDGPRDEIVRWLADSEEKLKVVSIVGFGGLGKTTLAKQVYDKIGEQFNFKAFVPVSQRPDMAALLIGLESKLKGTEICRTRKVHDIINDLREHLTDKRYFIVVDDLWDRPTWDIISCAFPDNGNGSRIIVTTRVEDVARLACRNHQECVYKIKPLNVQDSKRLFFSRVVAPEDVNPSQYEEGSTEILKRCGGLPLAIITIAGILASRPGILRRDWETIRSYLGVQSATDLTMEGMRRILNLSYMHLPAHLRVCSLHLGMHPEDHEIMRDDLVRQWIAESLVRGLPGQDLEDIGRSYFNELINRSLIQPEETFAGDVVSCRVHDMIRDVIISKCEEENFMSMVYNSEDIARLRKCKLKVRRLFMSSSCFGATNGAISRTTATSLSKVRSIVSFGKRKCLFSRYLRVLFIETQGPTVVNLSDISRLFHLRYLKVIARSISLPSELKGLVHLETLELDSHALMSDSIPADVVQLPRLSHLAAPGHRLPSGIGNLELLRTLNGFQLTDCSSEDIKGLGELTNLQELWFIIEDTIEIDDAFVSSIEKLRQLRHLRLSHEWCLDNDSLSSISNPPLLIETLVLKGIVSFRTPKWIGDLHYLRHLQLSVRETSTDDIRLLGELRFLVELKFILLRVAANGAFIIRTGLFPALEYFYSRFTERHDKLQSAQGHVMSNLRFEVGTMPKLQRLELELEEEHWGGATPVGMEHLLALQQIKVSFDHRYPSWYGPPVAIIELTRRAESAHRDALQAHPNRHSIRIN
ncbi:hypothetical protein CFC21_105752 [Triticum aestivum]|uniref:Uncharacterized protein n=3 Tax=Triticum TaxID=4564 RepID=A0A9R1MDA0_WHEAT|nr:disease resistance protein RGA5-like [Triticum aestivum]XP_044446369.1 disease resistance protein RGA5-like [Triticum aestivum]KAF7104889.1 hypothetical protein CFC21_105751 [Triticum aestivum]KAF7104890.1 hypothetical protein CFC21_105752 [Triticum aestivum]VAI93630.1 unnamed protein product [Triticum turgidum subsp. durum]